MYNDEEAILEVMKLVRIHETNDPFKLAKFCDYDVVEMNLTEKTWGQMVRSNRCCTIFVDITLPEPIKKFVVAHELGHCRLHRGHSTPFYRNIVNTSISKKEAQANVFALNLLLISIDERATMTNYELINYLGLPEEFERFM
ncbi:ImmA/IrrE family metallo-endopeptidase [Enterococcus gallinarum]|uniref:ImmA/IrrE family metallo-endopeptidase n=1 Tax=Enterococcus gallinarum TaxID=1353 RepID=UPI001AD7AB7B|nr:ImmA/IrrE family metallo-endopeptidase [Enterococcus gallinarum]MBO6419909.1 ImmA/IrrE family metallo-endopeptidase [Enterococcus gallinarum]MBO6423571.1 ImmA/IrrE family metallo-endopeptidase [Enterococcus gallinarum]